MTANYTSAISQQPLLSADDYGAVLGQFAPVAGAHFGAAAYPGGMVAPGAAALLGSSYGTDLNQDNAGNSVAFQRQYANQANQLFNAQQRDQAATGLRALEYANAQQAAGLGRTNQLRNFGLTSLNALSQLLGL